MMRESSYSPKTLSLLLVVLVTYGQLMANLHVVNHLPDQAHSVHHDKPGFASERASFKAIPFSELASLSSHHNHNHEYHLNRQHSESSELTCLLYHILLGFNGLLFIADSVSVFKQSTQHQRLNDYQVFARLKFSTLTIRAPPKLT